MHSDAFVLQNLADCRRNIFVFALDQPRSSFENGYFAPEAPEHLSEFKSDVAASDNDQVRGEEINVHHAAVGQIRNLVETRNRRYRGTSPHVDKYSLRGQS